MPAARRTNDDDDTPPRMNRAARRASRTDPVDLDSLEQEDVKEDFVVVIGKREIKLRDPGMLSLTQADAIQQPALFFDVVVDDEDDLEFVLEQNLPMFKVNYLLTRYRKHFGLVDRGNVRGSRR